MSGTALKNLAMESRLGDEALITETIEATWGPGSATPSLSGTLPAIPISNPPGLGMISGSVDSAVGISGTATWSYRSQSTSLASPFWYAGDT